MFFIISFRKYFLRIIIYAEIDIFLPKFHKKIVFEVIIIAVVFSSNTSFYTWL